MAKPRMMIVTAGRNQAGLILKAKEMGLEVTATDRDANAPSLSLADHSIIVDATDSDELLRVARDLRPDAIITETTDVGVAAVALTAERLSLPGIGSEAALRATNKWEMREACRHAGIPMPAYRLASSLEDVMVATREIGLPVIIKPIDNQSSRGVSKVAQIRDIPNATARAMAASRSGHLLVEELMLGVECSIESFVHGDDVEVLGISERVTCAPPHSYNLQILYPASFTPGIVAELKEMNRRVIEAIGIRMGFTHMEAILTSQGPRLVEIAARGSGARVTTDLLPHITGIDLLAARIKQALGDQIRLPEARQELFGIVRFFVLPSGQVKSIGGLTEAAAEPGVLHLEFSPKVGSHLKPPASADQRPGFVLAVGRTKAEVIGIAEKVALLVDVQTM